MAKQTSNKPRYGEVQKFELSKSQVIAENERLLSGSEQPAAEQPQSVADTHEQVPAEQSKSEADTNEQPAAEQPQSVADTHEQVPAEQPKSEAGTKEQSPAKGDSGRKIGINAFVPMDYYEKLVLLKMRTGVPIKEIALQAVKEYIDRNY